MSKTQVAWIFVTGLTCLAHTGVAQTSAGAVVAVVDGQPVSQTDLEARIGDKLLRLKTEEYEVRLSALNQYVDEVLLAREASSRKMGVDELLRTEITDKLPPVSDAEARAVMESAPSSNRKVSSDEALRAVIESINRLRGGKLRADFIADLRARRSFEITLEPPRLSRSIVGGHSAGPDDAPVSIVEFSDFQCPFCGKLTDALDGIRREYRSKVRLTYKQFPLSIHPQAAKAAEASLCAAHQGKFWEMHDQLFSEQRLLAAEAFSDLAGRAGLAVETFDACLKARATSGEVAKEKEEGASLGISSTPTFFVNGRMFVGAKSYGALADIIAAELGRVGSYAKPAKEAAAKTQH